MTWGHIAAVQGVYWSNGTMCTPSHTCFLGPTECAPKQHLHRFSHCAGLTARSDRDTHGQTTERHLWSYDLMALYKSVYYYYYYYYYYYSNRLQLHLATAAMWPRNTDRHTTESRAKTSMSTLSGLMSARHPCLAASSTLSAPCCSMSSTEDVLSRFCTVSSSFPAMYSAFTHRQTLPFNLGNV